MKNLNILMGVLCISIIIICVYSVFKSQPKSQNIKYKTITEQEVEQILFETRIEHPEVVFAQIILESDSMQSKIAVDNNNILGMKMPAQRPTLAIGIKNGHAEYKSVRDCILDYVIFQQIYYRNLSEEEYIDKLAKDYAQDPNYKEKLLKIMSQ